MFMLFRLMAGRRLIILAVLVVVAAAGTPALRQKATRVLACGVSLRAGDMLVGGAASASVVQAVSGVRVPRVTPQQCLRDAIRTTTAAPTWMQRRSRAQ